jgi:glucose-6-phosphate 1-dehydrogenase
MLHLSFSFFFVLQNVGIFGYSRKKVTDEDLRAIIEANLTCRVDHQYVLFT